MRDLPDYLNRNFNAGGIIETIKTYSYRWFILNIVISLLGIAIAVSAPIIIDHRNERAEALEIAKLKVLDADSILQQSLNSHWGPALFDGRDISEVQRGEIIRAIDAVFPLVDSVDQTDERIRDATTDLELALIGLKNSVKADDLRTLEGVTNARASVRIYYNAQEEFEKEIELFLDSVPRRLWN